MASIETAIQLIRLLKKECFDLKIPMIAIISYKTGDKEEKDKVFADVLTPAAMGYETKDKKTQRIFYSLQNLASGRFKTVLIDKVDGEDTEEIVEDDEEEDDE